MSETGLPHFERGDWPKASDLNELSDEIGRLGNVGGDLDEDGGETYSRGTGQGSRTARVQPLVVRITAHDGEGAHSWNEQERYVDSDGNYAYRDIPSGLEGDFATNINPLRAANGGVIQIGTIVQAWRRGATLNEWVTFSIGANDRWGILVEDVSSGQTTGSKCNWYYFARNSAMSGSLGAWSPVLDSEGNQATFLVIEFGILPSDKILKAGAKIHCEQAGEDVWAPDAASCANGTDTGPNDCAGPAPTNCPPGTTPCCQDNAWTCCPDAPPCPDLHPACLAGQHEVCVDGVWICVDDNSPNGQCQGSPAFSCNGGWHICCIQTTTGPQWSCCHD